MKRTIEVDQYVGLDHRFEGPVVVVDLFVGDSDEAVSDEVSFQQLLDEYVANNIIPNGTVTAGYRDDILKTLKAMRRLIKNKMEEVKKLPEWQGVKETRWGNHE